MRRLPALVVMTTALLSMGGCGITTENEPRRVQPPPGPYSLLTEAPTDPTEPGVVPVVLYLTHEGALAAVTRQARGAPSLSGLMEDLLAGPTETEQADGIGSALSGVNLIGEVRYSNGQAEVDLTTGLDGTGRSDVVLAIAQVVCTLDARPEVTGVVFVVGDEVIAVPRGDGALHKGPLTSVDYSCPASSGR